MPSHVFANRYRASGRSSKLIPAISSNPLQERKEIMFNIIRKIFLVVIFVRVLAVLANASSGPAKTIAILGIVVLGVRELFSRNTDKSND